MKQSKWHVGQRVIAWTAEQKGKYGVHPEGRRDFEVTAVGRKWITAKECTDHQWPSVYRFDMETRKGERGHEGRIAIDESDIAATKAADEVAQLRRERVARIGNGMRESMYERIDKQPDSVLDMFEAALSAAGWWKE